MNHPCTIQTRLNNTPIQKLSNPQNISRFIIGAQEDYVLSRILHLVSLHDSGMYHYQQCMEKFMKAFLIEKKISFRQTHILDYLRKKCADYDRFFNDPYLIDACEKVTPFEVWGRYPSPSAHSYGWIIPDLIYFLDEFVFEMRKKIKRSGFYDIISEMIHSGKINSLFGVSSSYLVHLFFLDNKYYSK